MNGYSEVASDFCACCGSTEGRIEIHHIQRRSQGGSDEAHNLIALCKSCHHLTDGHFLRFYRDDEDALWWERDDHYGRCVLPDECRQEPSPEALDEADGEALAEYERLLVAALEDANHAMWKASRIARDAYFVWRTADYTNREAMAKYKEWASELRDESGRLRPIAPSTARDMAITAALPDEDAIADMTLRERVRLVKALAADADYDEARDDVYALSREDFEAKHLGRPTWIEGDK